MNSAHLTPSASEKLSLLPPPIASNYSALDTKASDIKASDKKANLLGSQGHKELTATSHNSQASFPAYRIKKAITAYNSIFNDEKTENGIFCCIICLGDAAPIYRTKNNLMYRFSPTIKQIHNHAPQLEQGPDTTFGLAKECCANFAKSLCLAPFYTVGGALGCAQNLPACILSPFVCCCGCGCDELRFAGPAILTCSFSSYLLANGPLIKNSIQNLTCMCCYVAGACIDCNIETLDRNNHLTLVDPEKARELKSEAAPLPQQQASTSQPSLRKSSPPPLSSGMFSPAESALPSHPRTPPSPRSISPSSPRSFLLPSHPPIMSRDDGDLKKVPKI